MFKKKKKVTTGVRKREEEDMTAGAGEFGADKTEIVHAAKRAKKDFEIQATSKRDPNAASSSSATSSSRRAVDDLFDENEIVSGDKALSMADMMSSGKANATRSINVDEDHEKDQRSINERNAAIQQKLQAGELDSGIYRGKNAYKSYFEASEGKISTSKITGNMGPVRATAGTVRNAARFDHWGTSGDGGVCKEFKTTGFCGYGDSCIYMHDRTNYKSGWQLEREWDEKQKEKQKKQKAKWEKRIAEMGCVPVDGEEGDDSDSDDSDVDTSSEEEGGPGGAGGSSGANMYVQNKHGADVQEQDKGTWGRRPGGRPGGDGTRNWEVTSTAGQRMVGRKVEDEAAASSKVASSAVPTNQAASAGVGPGFANKISKKMPKACPNCEKSWDDIIEKENSFPVSTTCGHFLCDTCSMKLFRESKKCFTCGKPINGIFNNAEDKWDAKKARKATRKAARKANKGKSLQDSHNVFTAAADA